MQDFAFLSFWVWNISWHNPHEHCWPRWHIVTCSRRHLEQTTKRRDVRSLGTIFWRVMRFKKCRKSANALVQASKNGNKRTLRVCFSIFVAFSRAFHYKWSAIFCCQSMVISGHQCQIDLWAQNYLMGMLEPCPMFFQIPSTEIRFPPPTLDYYGILWDYLHKTKDKSVSSLVNTAAHHFCWAKSVNTSPPCPHHRSWAGKPTALAVGKVRVWQRCVCRDSGHHLLALQNQFFVSLEVGQCHIQSTFNFKCWLRIGPPY